MILRFQNILISDQDKLNRNRLHNRDFTEMYAKFAKIYVVM